MILTNCTDTRRGLVLRGGVKFLEGREMWSVPLEQQDEIRGLFRSRSFQRFMDNGIFRLAEMSADEESVTVPTPAPPADLTGPADVAGLQNPAGTATGSQASAPRVVEHQHGGPLIAGDAEAVTAAGAASTAPAAKSARAKKR